MSKVWRHLWSTPILRWIPSQVCPAAAEPLPCARASPCAAPPLKKICFLRFQFFKFFFFFLPRKTVFHQLQAGLGPRVRCCYNFCSPSLKTKESFLFWGFFSLNETEKKIGTFTSRLCASLSAHISLKERPTLSAFLLKLFLLLISSLTLKDEK